MVTDLFTNDFLATLARFLLLHTRAHIIHDPTTSQPGTCGYCRPGH
jgi:hypothetical protein